MYHAIQDAKDAASPEDLAAMDQEINNLREIISAAKVEEKILKANLVTLSATMTIQDLRAGVQSLDAEKATILNRLGPLRAGNVRPVLPEEKAKVDQAWRTWSRHAAGRKKICMNVWDYVTEELPEGKTKEDLWVQCDDGNRKRFR